MLKLKKVLTLIAPATHISITGGKYRFVPNDFDKEYLIYKGRKENLPLLLYEDFQNCAVMGIGPRLEEAEEEENLITVGTNLLDIDISVDKVPEYVLAGCKNKKLGG